MARDLRRALAGQTVTAFESSVPALSRVDVDRPIAGRTIESVSSRGKHLLIRLSGGLTLHTHMRMNGTWHVYPAGASWRRPRHDMRVMIATGAAVAVAFNVPIAEWLSDRDLERHHDLAALGPDFLSESFDRADAIARARAQGAAPIADVLLDQRVAAGVGNVLKSETLFVARIHPFATVASLSDVDLERVMDTARRLLRANVLEPHQTLSPFRGRRTTGSMNPHARLWVYGRAGERCRKCGAPIQLRKTGIDARLTYWCPVCQPAAAGVATRP